MKWLCDKHPSGKCWLVSLGDGLEIYVDTEEQARLIAAAPDLLESLEEFCGGLFRYPPGSIGDEVLQKAKAAIAKATGAPNAE